MRRMTAPPLLTVAQRDQQVLFQCAWLGVAALLHGFLYLVLLPPWQHYDEPSHFEYAWLIANRSLRPTVADIDGTMRRSVAQSMIEHNFYHDSAPPDIVQEDGTKISIGFGQLDKSPLYYAVVSLPLILLRSQDITTQLYAARAVSLLLYVTTVLIAFGIVRDLTPPNHPLRWMVALAVALVPPFADLMTAVNSDVGAITMFSLFLWGSVRAVRFGCTFRRLCWIMVAALLCAAVKDTSLVAVVLTPIAIMLSVWTWNRWSWRLFALIGSCTVAAAAVAVFGWGDAQSWYRWRGWDIAAPTRTSTSAVIGSHAVSMQAIQGSSYQVLNAVSDQDVALLAGQQVSVGGWMWAERPTSSVELGMMWSEQGSRRLEGITTPVTLTTTPTFVVHTYTVPERPGKLFYTAVANALPAGEQPVSMYLDGAVLVKGEFGSGTMPAFRDVDAHAGVWDGTNFVNLIRNASGESSWPRVRPWVAQWVPRLVNQERLWLVAPLFDVERSVPFVWRVGTAWLLSGMFGRFAWGQIWLQSSVLPIIQVLAGIAVVGCVFWWVRKEPVHHLRPALAFLGVAGFIVWVSVSLWPLSYVFVSSTPLPSSRYTFPAVIPTMLWLTGGWLSLWPRRYRFVGIYTLVGAMILLDGISIWTIWSYYNALG